MRLAESKSFYPPEISLLGFRRKGSIDAGTTEANGSGKFRHFGDNLLGEFYFNRKGTLEKLDGHRKDIASTLGRAPSAVHLTASFIREVCLVDLTAQIKSGDFDSLKHNSMVDFAFGMSVAVDSLLQANELSETIKRGERLTDLEPYEQILLDKIHEKPNGYSIFDAVISGFTNGLVPESAQDMNADLAMSGAKCAKKLYEILYPMASTPAPLQPKISTKTARGRVLH